LAQVRAKAWRIGWVGVAHATGNCAIVHNLGFLGDRTLAREVSDGPERRGWVGVAQPTRICALVRNLVRRARTSLASPIIKGWEIPP
jgi:hypothetical protein